MSTTQSYRLVVTLEPISKSESPYVFEFCVQVPNSTTFFQRHSWKELADELVRGWGPIDGYSEFDVTETHEVIEGSPSPIYPLHHIDEKESGFLAWLSAPTEDGKRIFELAVRGIHPRFTRQMAIEAFLAANGNPEDRYSVFTWALKEGLIVPALATGFPKLYSLRNL